MDTIKINQDTLDSLIFFCFGFTLDEDYPDIINRIIEKAYFDATNQGAFNTKADSKKAKIIKYGENGSLSIVIERLEMLEKEEMVKFDKWHNESCEMLLKKYEENGLEDIFTYGNAQKWINMTLKYIYLLNGISNSYAKEFLKITSKICRYSSEFHIPIDSYIIDILWDEKEVKLPFKNGVEKDRTHKYVRPSDYIKGWSNWNKDDYINMVDSLSEGIKKAPLKWESEQWIISAKKRKRNNSKE